MKPGPHAGSPPVTVAFIEAVARLIKTTVTAGRTSFILLSGSVSLLGKCARHMVSARSVIRRECKHARQPLRAGKAEPRALIRDENFPSAGQVKFGSERFPKSLGLLGIWKAVRACIRCDKKEGASRQTCITSGCRRPEPHDLTDIRAWPKKMESLAEK